MGNKKNILLILVVVALFGASGFVLYNGFFKGAGSTVVVDGNSSQQEIVNLLPYGTKLDFGSVEAHAELGTNVVYEVVDPKNITVDIHSLISPVKDEVPAEVNVVGQRGQRIQ